MSSSRRRIGWWGLIVLAGLGLINLADSWLRPVSGREAIGPTPIVQEQPPQMAVQQAVRVVPTEPVSGSQVARRPTVTLVAATPTSSPSPAATPTMTGTVHLIVAGDTFGQLANDYGVSLEAVLQANADLDPTSLQIGQAVVIPGASGPPVPRPTPTELPPAVADVLPAAGMEAAMFQAVNAERQGRGLHRYRLDEELVAVARAHAQDMALRGYFDHVTPEGKTLRDRLKEAGIEKHWVGENIRANTHPPDQAVGLTIGAFMGSQPHRENILAEPYTRLGVGVVEQPPGWFTYVLVFAGES